MKSPQHSIREKIREILIEIFIIVFAVSLSIFFTDPALKAKIIPDGQITQALINAFEVTSQKANEITKQIKLELEE